MSIVQVLLLHRFSVVALVLGKNVLSGVAQMLALHWDGTLQDLPLLDYLGTDWGGKAPN